jgi:hypothetical protein
MTCKFCLEVVEMDEHASALSGLQEGAGGRN